MSHFTKLDKANIVSQDAFLAACEELGLYEVIKNTTITDYYGNKTNVDVAVKVGRYHIGLQKNQAGTYDMIADWWGVRGNLPDGKLRTALGNQFSEEDIQDCMLRYTTKHTITQKYKKLGFRINVQEDENKSLIVNMTKF